MAVSFKKKACGVMRHYALSHELKFPALFCIHDRHVPDACLIQKCCFVCFTLRGAPVKRRSHNKALIKLFRLKQHAVQRASHIQCGCFIRIHRRMFAPEVNGRVNRNVIELRFTDAGTA